MLKKIESSIRSKVNKTTTSLCRSLGDECYVKHADPLLNQLNWSEVSCSRECEQLGVTLRSSRVESPVCFASDHFGVWLICGQRQFIVNYLTQIRIHIRVIEQISSPLVEREVDCGVRWSQIPRVCIKSVTNVFKTHKKLVSLHWEYLKFNWSGNNYGTTRIRF